MRLDRLPGTLDHASDHHSSGKRASAVGAPIIEGNIAFLRTRQHDPPATIVGCTGPARQVAAQRLQECFSSSPVNHFSLERAVPRRVHVDAEVCRGNPWRTKQDRYVLCRLIGLVPADVTVLAEIQVGLA